MKLSKIILACATAACLGAYSTTPAHAAVIYYDGTSGNSNFDVSFSQGGNVNNSTGNLSLGSQSWIDPGGNTANQTRYIGGTIAFNGSGTYSSNVNAQLYFKSSLTGGNIGVFGDSLSLLGNVSNTNWTENSPGRTIQLSLWTVSPSGASTMDVIFKLDKIAGTEAARNGYPAADVQVSVFLGSKADAGTEGTADYTFRLNYVQAIDILNINLQTAYTTSTNTLTTTNMFGADTWTPVGAVPEPATWALLAFSLTSVVVFRRRNS